MYFIVNKTKKTIHLPDIKITLGPRQAIDIDQLISRSESDSSNSLKSAKSKGEIEVRIKDKDKNEENKNIIEYRDNNSDVGEIKKMLNELKGVVENLSLNAKSGITEKGISQNDLKKMAETIASYMPSTVPQDDKNDEIESNMSDEILSIINAKTVNKIVEKTEIKSIRYDETDSHNSVLGNASELENLLG